MTLPSPATSFNHLTWQIEPRRSLLLANDQQFVLRPLAADDADRMVEFFANLTEREVYYFYRQNDERTRRLVSEVAQDTAFRLVAVGVNDGREEILGYTYLEWQETPVPTFGICIREGAQSAGLGRTLIDHLFTSAAASGVGLIKLTVHTDNWRALRLYQRFGFYPVGDFMNTHQKVKQYRMECDLRLPRPEIAEDLTIIPIGGLGFAAAVGELQRALEGVLKKRPLVLDREYRPGNRVIYVVDLGPQRFTLFDPRQPDEKEPHEGRGWITSLDETHLVIGGEGAAAVQRAVQRYVNFLGESVPLGSLRIIT